VQSAVGFVFLWDKERRKEKEWLMSKKESDLYNAKMPAKQR
jgi:hypothetical protein